MGAIGFGAGARPVGAGRVTPRRVRRGESADAAPHGGGDIRPMRKAGGFGSYSAVGFRAVPPIGSAPMPSAPEPDTAERELAAAGVPEPR